MAQHVLLHLHRATGEPGYRQLGRMLGQLEQQSWSSMK